MSRKKRKRNLYFTSSTFYKSSCFPCLFPFGLCGLSVKFHLKTLPAPFQPRETDTGAACPRAASEERAGTARGCGWASGQGSLCRTTLRPPACDLGQVTPPHLHLLLLRTCAVPRCLLASCWVPGTVPGSRDTRGRGLLPRGSPSRQEWRGINAECGIGNTREKQRSRKQGPLTGEWLMNGGASNVTEYHSVTQRRDLWTHAATWGVSRERCIIPRKSKSQTGNRRGVARGSR